MESFPAIRIALLTLILMCFHGCKPEPAYVLKTIVFEDNSYGYEIFLKGKLFIKQENIPAIPCKKHFKHKKEAIAVGNLVIQKIKSRELPSVELNELTRLGIDTNCLDLQVNKNKF